MTKLALVLAGVGVLLSGATLIPAGASAEIYGRESRHGYVREGDADRFGWDQYERGYRQGRADMEREARADRAYRRAAETRRFETDDAYGRRGLSLLREEREFGEGPYGRRGAFGRNYLGTEYEGED